MQARQTTVVDEELEVIPYVKEGNLEGLKKFFTDTEASAFSAGGDKLRTKIRGEMANEHDSLGRTPLHYVFNVNDITSSMAIADYLIKKGADVNAVDNSKDTPLYLTALVLGADKLQEGQGRFVETTMMMQCLIARGANPKLKDSKGRTPFSVYTTFVDPKQYLAILPKVIASGVGTHEFMVAYNDFYGVGGSGSDKEHSSKHHDKKKGGCAIS